MNQEKAFQNFIQAIQKRQRKEAFKSLALHLLLFLLISILTILVLERWVDTGLRISIQLKIATSLSVLLAILLVAFHWKSPGRFLREMDHRFGFQERLGTSYEYLKKESIFREKLVEDAVKSLRSVNPEDYFPKRSRYWLPGIFLLTVLVFSLLINSRQSADLKNLIGISGLNEKSSRENQQNWSDNPGIRRPQTETGRFRELSESLRDLRESGKSPREVKESIQSFLQSITVQQDQLKRKLREKLKEAGAFQQPEVGKEDDLLQYDDRLQEFIRKLKSSFKGEVPSELSENLEKLADLEDLKDYLDETLQKLDREPPQKEGGDDADNQPRKEDQELAIGQKRDNTDDSSPGGESEQKGEMSIEEKVALKSKGIRSDPGEAEQQPERKQHEDEHVSTLPGQTESEWDSRLPGLTGTPDGEITKLKGKTGDGEWYRSLIRSLVKTDPLSSEEKAYIREYRRDLESVLHREEIPVARREMIKRYFLSIGFSNIDEDN